MLQILEGFGLVQHVHEATHSHGPTLDVLITRDTNRLSGTAKVKDIGICDDKGNLIKGHYSIIYHINERRFQSNLKLCRTAILTLYLPVFLKWNMVFKSSYNT